MELKITLKSDLCAASGDGFSSSVDTDVVYDKFGLPFIPSTRIKGALRKIAIDVLQPDRIDKIFGVTGSGTSGALHISNAFIEDYDKAKEYLTKNSIDNQRILNLFTYTRAQTAMKNGVAMNGSLRFTRVVSHYFLDKEATFSARVQIDEAYSDDLEKLCKGFRNLGFNKNRGFGSIKCELIRDDDTFDNKSFSLDSDKLYKLNYQISLETPVIISLNGTQNTCTYIPGSSVMGYFANKLNQDQALFREMFLKDKVKFSNLYPIKKNGGKCVPAISVIGKNKLASKSKDKYLSVFDNSQDRVIKPLKDGFIDENCKPYQVDSEVMFHNAMSSDKRLYTNRCISANQRFYGSIIAKGEYIEKIVEVMNSGTMSIGRSKTSQYSVCLIDEMSVDEYYDSFVAANEDVAPFDSAKQHILVRAERDTDISKDEVLVYALDSNLILTKDNGTTFVDIDDIKSAIEDKAGLDLGKLCDETSIFYKSISGYNAKWNQKKPQIRCIAMGSSIVFKAVSGTKYPCELFVGDRCEEGFGHLVLYKLAEKLTQKNKAKCNEDNSADDGSFLLKDLLENANNDEELMKTALDYVISGNDKSIVSSNTAFIGRVLKMISESEDIKDFENRVEVIKDVSKRTGVNTIISKVKVDNSIADTDKLKYLSYLYTYARYAVKSKRFEKNYSNQNNRPYNKGNWNNKSYNRGGSNYKGGAR